MSEVINNSVNATSSIGTMNNIEILMHLVYVHVSTTLETV